MDCLFHHTRPGIQVYRMIELENVQGTNTSMIIDIHEGTIRDGKIFRERASRNKIFINSQSTANQVTDYRQKTCLSSERISWPVHNKVSNAKMTVVVTGTVDTLSLQRGCAWKHTACSKWCSWQKGFNWTLEEMIRQLQNVDPWARQLTCPLQASQCHHHWRQPQKAEERFWVPKD